MRVIVSGLSEPTSRLLVGEFLWRGHSIEWMDAHRAVDQLQSQKPDSDELLLWLYRSPASEAISAADGNSSIEEVLSQWSRVNRALLDALGAQTSARLINVDGVRRGHFPSAVFRGEGPSTTECSPSATEAARDPRHRLILHLLVFAAPECVAVYRDLEIAEWSANPPDPALEGIGSAPKAEILSLLDLVAATGESRTRSELESHAEQLRFELFEASTQLSAVLGENELLLVQLKQLQGDVRARQARSK